MPGSARCTGPACNATPAVASNFTAGYADAWLNMIGVLSAANMNANYDRDGNLFPVGDPIARRYATDEYEFFVQDTLADQSGVDPHGWAALHALLAALGDERPPSGTHHQHGRVVCPTRAVREGWDSFEPRVRWFNST